MATLQQFTDHLEIYSIDEAFLQLPEGNNEAVATEIRRTVRRWTRIPVSVGIAKTKVLAKVAGYLAKKYPSFNGVCDITNEDNELILHDFPVEEIWGIGRKSAKKLQSLGILTAAELLKQPDTWIRKHLSLPGLHIAYELRGTPCFKLDDSPEPKKGIMCTRSFGRAITKLEDLKEAVATYTQRAAEKLRQEKLVAGYFSVFIRTNRFNLDKKYIGSTKKVSRTSSDRCNFFFVIKFIPNTKLSVERIMSRLVKLFRILWKTKELTTQRICVWFIVSLVNQNSDLMRNIRLYTNFFIKISMQSMMICLKLKLTTPCHYKFASEQKY
jgi:nucleotidyltransferase/DNA polymerase involved in DNA repair